MSTTLLRQVSWVDLTRLRPHEVLHEILLSAPWLAVSLVSAANHWYWLALPASFMFFLTGLRQVHNAFHHSLGLPRWVSDWAMLVLSVLMLGSMHAVQINHLRHHQHCMAEDDIEAMGARLSALGAILLGPRYPYQLHRKAFEVAPLAQRRWMYLELAANVLWISVVFWLIAVPALEYHVVAMAVGQCFTAFFAVWTTHHDCGPEGPIARSIRSRCKALLTYNMFYHFEHHMFPAVPTCKLPILARRIDRIAPHLDLKNVY